MVRRSHFLSDITFLHFYRTLRIWTYHKKVCLSHFFVIGRLFYFFTGSFSSFFAATFRKPADSYITGLQLQKHVSFLRQHRTILLWYCFKFHIASDKNQQLVHRKIPKLPHPERDKDQRRTVSHRCGLYESDRRCCPQSTR